MASLQNCHSIEDLRQLGMKRIPRVMFDYIQGSSEDEVTAQWNIDSFRRFEFIPRVLRNVKEIDLSATVCGISSKVPFIASPTGMSRLFHHQGELAVSKATSNIGSIYSLSTVSTTSIEDVAAASSCPKLFQIYAWQNKAMTDDFIARCKMADYAGLMLAVDAPTLGKRERDLKNGHGRPALLRRNTALSALRTPGWLFHFLTKPKLRMANMLEHLPHGADVTKVTESINEQFRADVTWDDVKSIQSKWDKPFFLKGIQSVADAVMAAEHGVQGIILSNHGGRQLDGAPAAMDLLPEVIAAVGSDVDVLIDGGIRRGSDIVKAIALGAKAVLLGRAYLYGLAAGGEAGVQRAYDILTDEIIRVMQLLGCSSIQDLDSSYIRPHRELSGSK